MTRAEPVEKPGFTAPAIQRVPRGSIPADFGRVIGMGWDTIRETYDWRPTDALCSRLEKAKRAAQSNGRFQEPVSIELAGVLVRVRPHGGRGGVKWILDHDDWTVDIRDPGTDWPVTVTYSAAGLWEHGAVGLRRRFGDMLKPWCVVNAGVGKLSRCDFAIDMHAPGFCPTSEFLAGVLVPSGAKYRGVIEPWLKAGRLETVTIGSRSALQVQLYNKGLEIKEASGKFWMLSVWREQGYRPDDDGGIRDVWRLEFRFGRDWLRDRDLRNPETLDEHLSEMLAEAVKTRRMTTPNGSKNRSRDWPLHPIVELALSGLSRSAEMMLVRRFRPEPTREQLDEILARGIAGSIRASAILATGEYDEAAARRLCDRVIELIANDPEHARKVQRVQERYRDIDEAR